MKSLARAILVLAVLPVLVFGGPARSDWINLTGAETAPNIAEFHIEADGLRVVLEVYVGDLEVFRDLVPDDLLADPGADDRGPMEERLRRFSSRTLRVTTDSGETLVARLETAEPRLRKDRFSPFAGLVNPMTGQPAPEPPADKRVLYVELFYPFREPPRSLTFVPPLDDEGNPRVSMGFAAYHDTVPVTDFRFLTGSSTVRLDWGDPWYSRFDNAKLTRHHKSGLMSFLYVESHEVRHEILARVRDLENWIDFELRDPRHIEADEWEGVKDRVVDFLMRRNPVRIDEEPVEPIFDRANFVTVSLQGVRIIDEPRRVATPTAIVGVIFAYITDRIPERVTVDWDLFTENIRQVPVVATDPAGPFPSFVDPDDPVLEWRNFLNDYRDPVWAPVSFGPERFLTVPVLTVVLALLSVAAAGLALKPFWLRRRAWAAVTLVGLVAAFALSPLAVAKIENPLAGLPDETAAAEIVRKMVGNLHNALRLRDEVELRTSLASSVVEANFPEVLPELRRALAIGIQGGGTARVEAVDNVVVRDIGKLSDGPGFRAQADWSADARASHWGHLHRRKMRFSALMEFVPAERSWKLAGITVVGVKEES